MHASPVFHAEAAPGAAGVVTGCTSVRADSLELHRDRDGVCDEIDGVCDDTGADGV